MDPYSLFDTRLRGDFYNTGQLRRSTLTSLRWMAIAGQLLALVVVSFMGMDLHIAVCLGVIAVSALANLVFIKLMPLNRRISNCEAGAQLFFDVVQLSTLLYLPGGMQNPFALLLLAPVVGAAKTLNRAVFASIAAAVSLLSGLILFIHLPLPWYVGQEFSSPQMYQYGSWLALQVGMLFTSTYTWRATAQTRRLTQALAATDAILAHEKKLSALGGMAAAAAHKLGTPLSTIQLVAKEIVNDAKPGSELSEDALLLLSQAQHCREILLELAQRGDKGDAMHDQLSLSDLVREITEPFVGFEAQIVTKITGPTSGPKSGVAMPVLTRRPEFVYGLTNIVENAADFAKTKVEVTGTWTDKTISVEVRDDGPGFAPSVLAKIGEPYISHRPDKQHKPQRAGGMGLGVFIATTLMERVGGSIKFSNRKTTSGTLVQMCWPRD